MRRGGLVRIARKFDALIISDDVYDFLQWPVGDGKPVLGGTPFTLSAQMSLPRLCDIDMALGRSQHDPPDRHFGHAISNGSFSKIVGPGVRTGWVEGTKDFAFGLSQTGSSRSGGAPSQLAAVMMCDILQSGELDRHLHGVARPALRRRHQLMMKAIAEHIVTAPAGGGVEVRETSMASSKMYGGYFVWFTLPNHISSRLVAERSREREGLVIGHGEQFEVYGDEAAARFGNAIRLCFSWEPEEALVEGVERLGRVIRSLDEESRTTGVVPSSQIPLSPESVDDVK